MIRAIRMWFWLATMDVIANLGGFGSRFYLWAVDKASCCVDWE